MELPGPAAVTDTEPLGDGRAELLRALRLGRSSPRSDISRARSDLTSSHVLI